MDSGQATVRNVRSKCRCSCVLQFTFRHAVGCVLHRPPSQVIHCIVLCFQIVPAEKVGSQKEAITHSFTSPNRERAPFQNSRKGGESLDGWLSPSDYRRSTVPKTRAAGSQGDLDSRPPATHGVTPPADRPVAHRSRSKQEHAPRYPRELGLEVCASHTRRHTQKPIMILPQVHLRKPCYDFYFL